MQQPVRPETMSARLGEIFSPPCYTTSYTPGHLWSAGWEGGGAVSETLPQFSVLTQPVECAVVVVVVVQTLQTGRSAVRGLGGNI